MTDMNRYATKLLDEFEEICRVNDIEYQLAWEPEKIGAGVIMSAEDAARFVDAAHAINAGNRAVECWNNSHAYPNSTIRYVGTDSICYNVLDYTNFIYHGIFIEINIIRPVPKSLGEKIIRAQERGISRHSYTFKSRNSGTGSSRDEFLYKWGLRLSGGAAGLRKKCFDSILREKSPDFDSEEAKRFKPVKYSQEYIDYCVVFEDMGLDDLGGEEGLLQVLAGDRLVRVRDDKARLDRLREDNAPNFKIAREAWEIVKQVDEEIKQETGAVETKDHDITGVAGGDSER